MGVKINQILSDWLPGDIHSLSWMVKQGVGRGHVQRWAWHYHDRGVLEKIGPGIYKKPNDSASWLGALRLVQQELGKSWHISGRSALELHGAAHFVPLAERPVIILTTYGPDKLPKWFREGDFGCDFIFRKSKLFEEDFFSAHRSELLSDYTENLLSAQCSCEELAILEFFGTLELGLDFESAQNYLNGLPFLRAGILQILLEHCTSVKVKRVFLYLSEELRLAYFSKLDVSSINLGKGKRQIVKGHCMFDKKYQITVPKKYDDYL